MRKLFFRQTDPLVARAKEQAPEPKTLPVPSCLLSPKRGRGLEMTSYIEPSFLIPLPRRE